MIAIDLADGKSTTATHYPAPDPAGALLVLAHGAGAGQTHPFMVNTASGLAARGVDVVTFDFAYMHAKRGAPEKAPALEACFRRVIDTARDLPGMGDRRLFIGGKSMGGRMATHLAAQHEPAVAGVVVLGYPLHPPGAPDKLRVAHLPDITAPLLIVQGERDAFGSPTELEPHLATVPGAVTLHLVAGADHSLAVRGKRGAEVFEGILTTISGWMQSLR